MQLINGINVLIGKEGVLPITHEAYFLAEHFNIPIKIFIYRLDNRLKNTSDAMMMLKRYELTYLDVEFYDHIDHTCSFLCNYDKVYTLGRYQQIRNEQSNKNDYLVKVKKYADVKTIRISYRFTILYKLILGRLNSLRPMSLVPIPLEIYKSVLFTL